jgi:hypothetical protein
MQKQDGGMGTLRRTVSGALSIAILACPAMVAAGDALPTAQGSGAQVRQTRAQVNVQAKQRKAEARENPRALSGFVFQPPMMLEGPFVTNHVRVDTGMGMLRQDGVASDGTIPGAPATYDLRLGALEGRTSLGFALTPKLGLRLDGSILAARGANSQSGLHLGSAVAFEVSPGLKFGLVNNQDLGIAVALRAYGIASQSMGMRPTVMSDGSTTQGRTLAKNTAPSVTMAHSETSMAGGGVSLSAAKNIGKHVGAQMEVGSEISRNVVTDTVDGRVGTNTRTIFAGTAASMDLSPIAPVGAMVEYRIDHSVTPVIESTDASVSTGTVGRSIMHRMSAGLFYTAQKNLALGVVGTYGLVRGTALGATSMGKPAHLAGGRLTLGYFF